MEEVIKESLNDVEMEPQTFYIGMIDTMCASDGEVYIYQGNKQLVLYASDLFHWLDSLVRLTIEQKKETDNLIYDSLKEYIDGLNAD